MTARKHPNPSPLIPVGDPTDPHSIERHLTEWLGYLEVHNFATTSIVVRRVHLRQLQRWLDDRSIVRTGEVTKPVLERFQRHLFHYRKPNGRPLSFRTQKERLGHVRSFFKWCARTNRILYNPASELELPRTESRLPVTSLTAEEVEQVMVLPDLADPIGLRDRAILEVFYSTGIRRMELIGLQLFDVDADRQTLIIRQGKGKRDRVVPIGERALAWVEAYLRDARPHFVVEPDEHILFLTRAGEDLGPGILTHRTGRYVARAQLGKKGSCHLFRHTMATLMLEGGADIRYVQEILGHADLTSTQIYTHVSIERLTAIHRACHPGSANARHRVVGPLDGTDDTPDMPEADLKALLLSVLEAEVDAEIRDRTDRPEAS